MSSSGSPSPSPSPSPVGSAANDATKVLNNKNAPLPSTISLSLHARKGEPLTRLRAMAGLPNDVCWDHNTVNDSYEVLCQRIRDRLGDIPPKLHWPEGAHPYIQPRHGKAQHKFVELTKENAKEQIKKAWTIEHNRIAHTPDVEVKVHIFVYLSSIAKSGRKSKKAAAAAAAQSEAEEVDEVEEDEVEDDEEVVVPPPAPTPAPVAKKAARKKGPAADAALTPAPSATSLGSQNGTIKTKDPQMVRDVVQRAVAQQLIEPLGPHATTYLVDVLCHRSGALKPLHVVLPTSEGFKKCQQQDKDEAAAAAAAAKPLKRKRKSKQQADQVVEQQQQSLGAGIEVDADEEEYRTIRISGGAMKFHMGDLRRALGIK